MINPTPAEEARCGADARHHVPTREDMDEIETSSRLYQDGGAISATANVANGILRENPKPMPSAIPDADTPATPRRNYRLRITWFSSHCERTPVCETVPAALANLLELLSTGWPTVIRVGAEIEATSRQAFRRARSDRQDRSCMTTPALQALLENGSAQDAPSARIRR
jgi:magnesium transporter